MENVGAKCRQRERGTLVMISLILITETISTYAPEPPRQAKQLIKSYY